MFYIIHNKSFYGVSREKSKIIDYVKKGYLFEKLKLVRFWWGTIDGLRDRGSNLSIVSYGWG